MKYWLFSAKPTMWGHEGDDFNSMLESLERTTWRMSSFDGVSIGDKGVIKIGRDDRNKKDLNGQDRLESGIYAIVQIVNLGNEYKPEDKTKKIKNVDIQVIQNLYHSPISSQTLKKEMKVEFMNKFEGQGSSFNISEEEFSLIKQFTKNAPNTVKEFSYPLNQILYGPPGTGKTYNTITKALEIIDGSVPSERQDAKAKFEEYRKSGQIEFVTFHQSYGYEEFVEGIRAIPVGEEGNEDGEEMIYAIKDGIFKKMSKLSLENYTKNNHIASPKRKFFLHAKTLNIQAEMIEEDSNTYRVLKGSKIRKGQAASFENYNYVALKNKLLGQAKLKEETEFYILEEDCIFQSMSAASSVILGRQSNGYNDWKEVSDENNLFTQDEEKRNYILIIDEINRGNISKIFGELITLIESSKRIGEDEEIRVTLPYSGDSFGVPNNLYIIGTMNTADRSIALMDTALRRRFHFEEKMPDLSLLSNGDKKVIDYNSNFPQDNDLKVHEINIRLLLKKINERIEYLYDRDHTIGHAYFMDIKDPNKQNLETLSNIFRNKIIPLLQEYFYDDWEKIRLVLGDNQKTGENKQYQFIKIKEGYALKTLFGDTQHELLDNDDSSKVYEINKDAFSNPESYVKIYG